MPNEQLAVVAERLLLRALSVAKTVGLRVWRSNPLLYLALTALNVFLARRIFGGGIFADNDSVCHYAYLLHLHDEFYPATGTYLGFSPKFNMGVPFLLYNTPPGTYVAAAVSATVLHVSPLMGLKLVMLAAFCSVPLGAAAIAQTFEKENTDLPKFVALTFSLFSSELFGLEFYFKNGMLNPALGVPLMLFALAMFRRAQQRTSTAALPYLAMSGLLFAATIMTHVLTAYMFCVALVAFVLGPGLKTMGTNAIKASTVIAIGGLLAAEWLIPSQIFAAKEDVAYTWLRNPSDIWGHLLRGELFSSYPVGFFPTFITTSSSSACALLAATVGAYFAIAKRNGGAISSLILFVLAFWIVLGPTYATGISILPVYDRLLWYRFVTLAAVGLFLLAGYGAWKLSSSGFRYYPLNLVILGAAGIWSFFVVTQRAVKIHTASEFPQFIASVKHVSTWLRDHGDKRGRVYSEFLGQGVVQPPSVNYTRHMIPILSGFDEVSGWIYENNPASQDLQKKGPFWYNPFPMIASAETYDVKYIVAGSPQFIHALSIDPRWKLVDATPDLELFEAQSFEASMLSRKGASIEHEGYVRGGGYTYDVALDADQAPGQELVLRTNYAPVWTATMDGAQVPLAQTPEGLLELKIPADLHGKHTIHLAWSITAARTTGRKLTVVGIVIFLLFFALDRLPFAAAAFARIPPSVPNIVGSFGVLVAVAGLAWHSRKLDLSPIGYGIRGGLEETVDPKGITVGSYDDDAPDRLVHVLDGAFGDRMLSSHLPGRTLRPGNEGAIRLALTPDKNGLLVRGIAGTDGTPFTARLTRTTDGTVACEIAGAFGKSMELPVACTQGGTTNELPGIVRDLTVVAAPLETITKVKLTNDMVVVEGESFQNAYDDGGYDAFYGIGGVERFAENGVTMGGDALLEQPIVIKKVLRLEQGKVYGLWALIRVLHERFRATRATIFFEDGGKPIGALDGVSKNAIDFWDRDLRFEWQNVGNIVSAGENDIKIRFERNGGAVGGLADLDAVAFVPTGSR